MRRGDELKVELLDSVYFLFDEMEILILLQTMICTTSTTSSRTQIHLRIGRHQCQLGNYTRAKFSTYMHPCQLGNYTRAHHSACPQIT